MSEYCDPSGPKKFGDKLDIAARIDPSEDGDETSVVIPHDFSIRKFFSFFLDVCCVEGLVVNCWVYV